MTDKNNNDGFSFEKAGKKMPYTVPDGFFEKMQADIIARSLTAAPTNTVSRSRRLRWRAWVCAVTATAAAVALVLTLTVALPHTETPDQMSVEQAFSNLSAADQEYIIDTFRNDMILDYDF